MDQPVIPFDLHRMFLGDQPPLFYAEILFRTLLIYLYTLAMIRWIGGRGVAQMSMVEFVLVIALGSAVGDSMFYPDVPLLMAMVVITGVIGMNKFLDILIMRSDRAKAVIDGRPVALVLHGRLLPEGLAACDMGPAEVKSLLRLKGIANLGEVAHAFVEGGGSLSVFRQDPPRPGLPLVPPQSVTALLPCDGTAAMPGVASGGQACCAECGATLPAETVLPGGACPHCGHHHWLAPTICDSTEPDR